MNQPQTATATQVTEPMRITLRMIDRAIRSSSLSDEIKREGLSAANEAMVSGDWSVLKKWMGNLPAPVGYKKWVYQRPRRAGDL